MLFGILIIKYYPLRFTTTNAVISDFISKLQVYSKMYNNLLFIFKNYSKHDETEKNSHKIFKQIFEQALNKLFKIFIENDMKLKGNINKNPSDTIVLKGFLCARGRNRTDTHLAVNRILSPARLPVPPPGLKFSEC